MRSLAHFSTGRQSGNKKRRRSFIGRRKKVNGGEVSHIREVGICSAVMPRHCSAGGCKSRDNRESRTAGITFHKLPKEETRRKLWITNSRRADPWDPQSDFVYFCSRHFTPESFELTGYSGIRRLREDAFPTVFNLPATAKPKRAGRLQKQGDTSLRKNLLSSDQEKTQERQEKDDSHPSEEAAGQRSAAAPEQTPENTPAPSQGLSEGGANSPEEKAPPPEPEPRPVSPSRYMRRLPPPPGFYLSKEHSYAQLCPLLWRKRYDQAIGCLEKALMQLHAARRRENRLRSTVHRLQDKRLRQALQVSRDLFKDRTSWRSWSPGGERRRGLGGCDLGEGEKDVCEDTGESEDGGGDQLELGGSISGYEEERGRCFFCGRGQGKSRGSKTGDHRQNTAEDVSQRKNSNCPRSNAEKVQETEMFRSQSPPEMRPSGSGPSVLVQTQTLQPVTPAGPSLSGVHEQFLGSQQTFVLSEGDPESAGQQLFWLQDCAQGQVVLVPVPTEERLQGLLKKDSDGVQTVLVSEVDLKGGFGQLTESGGGLCGDGELNEQQTVPNLREDVREKLKEHLEGFHLQLSSEFLT
ncbi:THAP domain-containing protein 7 [Xyrichtys novacula]|uniref:THAP domain-containing protein 7 n=1 Tax=Xyrichtys novacula TaxID=13765 RepID=A0AAV1HF79_XYRNO|nr:THAP domain-containing protein 7 [Xyrichtys novacula]